MQKPNNEDLLMVLILTLLSVICILFTGLNLYPIPSFINYIPYILLLLFLPGYSLLAINNPLLAEKSIINRVGVSIAVSLMISIFLALLLTYTPLKIFNSIIVYVVAFFTIVMALIGILKRRKYHYVHFIEPEISEQAPDKEKVKIEKKEDVETPPLKIEKVVKLKQQELKTNNPELKLDKQEESHKQGTKHDEDEQHELTPVKHEKKSQTSKILLDIFKKNRTDKISAKKVESKAAKMDKSEINPEKLSYKLRPIKPKPKKKRFGYLDLIIVLFLTILSLVFVLEPGLNNSILHTVMGLFLMLFLPGYALIASIYPKKNDLNGVIRVVLSFGVSYFLTSIFGLILNYTPLGDNFNSILLVLSVITLILTGVAFWARIRLQEVERFSVGFGSSHHILSAFVGNSRNRNILLVVIIIVLALFIATPAYNLMKPADDVKFTEFYVLGPDGNNISNYPTNLTQGENGSVNIVLINHENSNTTYRIVIASNQSVTNEINVTLKPNEKKEIPYNFTAGEAGTVKLEFSLYKLPNITEVYRSHSLWVNIVELITETTYDDTSTDNTDTTDTTDNTDTTDTTDYTEPVDDTEYTG